MLVTRIMDKKIVAINSKKVLTREIRQNTHYSVQHKNYCRLTKVIIFDSIIHRRVALSKLRNSILLLALNHSI